MNTTHWPVELRVIADKSALEVTFETGETMSLSAELLRVESPSAEVQGHGEGQKTTPAGKQNVCIAQISPVGNYAVKITFDDGHDTGLFSWDLLYDYGTRQAVLIEEYLARLAADGLSRS